MKKTLVFISLLMVSLCFFSGNLFAHERFEKIDYLSSHVVKEEDYLFVDEDNIFIGNFFNLTNESLNSLKENLGDRTMFVYYLNLNDDIDIIDLKETHAMVYKYINGILNKSSFSTSEKDVDEIRNEIIEFFREQLISDTVHAQSMQTRALDDELFSIVYTGSRRFQRKPYGYIDVAYTVLKYRVDDISSLWLIETRASYTPGYVAKNNGGEGWEKFKNHSGYLHLQAYQPVHEVSQSYRYPGGTPKYKDAYPVNQPGKVTISSSFNIGASIGYSWKNGFSTSGASSGTDLGVGLNIGFGYSKTYEYPEPHMTAQRGSENSDQFQWYYDYAKAHGKIETNHLNTGYIFEQNNTGHYLDEDCIGMKYSVKMEVRKTILMFYNSETIIDDWYIGYHP